MLVKVVQSVDFQALGVRECEFGFTRANISCVYVFYEPPPSPSLTTATTAGSTAAAAAAAAGAQPLVQMVVHGRVDPGGNVGQWVAHRFLSAYAPSLLQLATCGDAKYCWRHAVLHMTSRRSWVADKLRRACHVCLKGFHVGRPRHHCRACAEIMCSRCTTHLTVLQSVKPPAEAPEDKEEDDDDPTSGLEPLKTEKICAKCILVHRASRHPLPPTLLPPSQSQSLEAIGDTFLLPNAAVAGHNEQEDDRQPENPFFERLDQSLAEQQALLRVMVWEGQRMMRHHHQQQQLQLQLPQQRLEGAS